MFPFLRSSHPPLRTIHFGFNQRTPDGRIPLLQSPFPLFRYSSKKLQCFIPLLSSDHLDSVCIP